MFRGPSAPALFPAFGLPHVREPIEHPSAGCWGNFQLRIQGAAMMDELSLVGKFLKSGGQPFDPHGNRFSLPGVDFSWRSL